MTLYSIHEPCVHVTVPGSGRSRTTAPHPRVLVLTVMTRSTITTDLRVPLATDSAAGVVVYFTTAAVAGA